MSDLMHSESIRSRFWQYVHRRQDHQCWPWIASTMKRGGYGQLRDGQKTLKSHRIAWELHFGSIPKGLLIRHLCNNPLCCNPSHLMPGTSKQNHDDMRMAGRMFVPMPPQGNNHHGAKLTEEQVKFVLTSNASGSELARRLGVTNAMISRIRNRKAWKHLTLT